MDESRQKSSLETNEKRISLLEERIDQLKASLREKEDRIRHLKKSRQRARDRLKRKLTLFNGSEYLMPLREHAASSLLKGIEIRLCHILWEVLQEPEFCKDDNVFTNYGIRISEFIKGNFEFQFMNLCEHVQRLGAPGIVTSALNKTRRRFLRERYDADARLSSEELQEAMVAFFALREARNAQAHIFDEVDDNSRKAQRVLLSDLEEALRGHIPAPRLKGMEPLLWLEVSSRLQDFN